MVESISETQNAWVTVGTGDTCIVLHRLPWICFTDVSRPWIGSRREWRLDLTVLIDNPVKHVPSLYGGLLAGVYGVCVFFPGARVASPNRLSQPTVRSTEPDVIVVQLQEIQAAMTPIGDLLRGADGRCSMAAVKSE